MNAPEEKIESLANRIAREHREVRQAIEGVQRVLLKASQKELAAELCSELVRPLTAFRDHLRLHFEFEEDGGIMERAGEISEGTKRKCEELVAQHRDFLARADELVEATESLAASNSPVPAGVIARIDQLFTSLFQHEHEENVLFQHLVYEDLGGGD